MFGMSLSDSWVVVFLRGWGVVGGFYERVSGKSTSNSFLLSGKSSVACFLGST